MLQAFFAHVVAEREDEVVGLVMVRLIECRGFAYQPRKRVEDRRLDLDIVGCLACYVEIVLRRDLRRQWNFAEVASGDEWRIDQRVDGNGLEAGLVARLSGAGPLRRRQRAA